MSRNDLDIETLCPQEDPHDHGTEHHGDHHHLSPHLPRPRCECHLSTLCSTVWGGRLRKRFCNMFSESSTGSWDELQLPCCPSKQGELPENMLQSLFLNLPPQTVRQSSRLVVTGHCASPITFIIFGPTYSHYVAVTHLLVASGIFYDPVEELHNLAERLH